MSSLTAQTRAPERELLSIYPRTFRLLAWTMMGISTLMALYPISKMDLTATPISVWMQIFVIFLGGWWLSRCRIILTTQRIAYTQPMLVTEIERHQVQDIKIVPDQRTQQLLNQPKWLQAMSRRALNQPDDYWRKHGGLWFQHEQKQLSLTRMSLRILPLHIMSHEQRHDLIQHLQTHWGFAVNEVARVAVSPIASDINQQDIGKRCLYVLFTGMILFIAMCFAPAFLLAGSHFGVESYLPLIPFILITVLVSYLFIRAEAKAYPAIAAILTGSVLGGALYFSALQLNRWYSEQQHQTQVATLFLDHYNEDVQVWKLPADLSETLGIEHLYFSPKTDGFDGSLKAQTHYSMTIKQGMFQDYFVDRETMQSIREVSQ